MVKEALDIINPESPFSRRQIERSLSNMKPGDFRHIQRVIDRLKKQKAKEAAAPKKNEREKRTRKAKRKKANLRAAHRR